MEKERKNKKLLSSKTLHKTRFIYFNYGLYFFVIRIKYNNKTLYETVIEIENNI